MMQNYFFNEMEWSYRQAELEKKLERKRQLLEAKNLVRLEGETIRNNSGANNSEIFNSKNKKIGKETLGWN